MKRITTSSSRDRRRKKIRSKISGTHSTPRLSVFKSNTAISAQLIDDEKSVTLASATSREIKKAKNVAEEVGKLIAERALAKKISKAVFDRGGYIFTGKVAALAKGARAGGLKF